MQKKFYKIDPGPMPTKVLPILALIIKILNECYLRRKKVYNIGSIS